MATISGIETWLAANQEVLLIVAGATIFGYFLYRNLDERAFKDYESKSLEERLFPEIKYMAWKLGQNSNQPLYHGDHNYLGNAQKTWFTTISKEELKKIGMSVSHMDDGDKQDVCIAMIRPSKDGFLPVQYYSWLITDIFMGKNTQTDLYCFRDKSIVEDSLDRMKIGKEANFGSYAGVLVEQDQATIGKIKNIAWRMNNEELQNKFPEFAEKVSEANPRHAESISEIKEINEANKRKDIERMAKK